MTLWLMFLPLTKHSHIELESTAIGGVVTYQCDDGFEPTERRLTVCSSTGHWVPDTAAFRCTEPGVHVFVHVSIYSSLLIVSGISYVYMYYTSHVHNYT